MFLVALALMQSPMVVSASLHNSTSCGKGAAYMGYWLEQERVNCPSDEQCLRTKIDGTVGQLCGKGMCALVVNPTKCCNLPEDSMPEGTSEYKIICNGSYETNPSASDFENCSDTCELATSDAVALTSHFPFLAAFIVAVIYG